MNSSWMLSGMAWTGPDWASCAISVVERQRATGCELIHGRRALHLGVLRPGGVFHLADLDAHRTREEPSPALDVLGMKVGDRRRSRHLDCRGKAVGRNLDAVLGQPHQGL